MPLNTITVGAAVTPTVIETYISHYTDRKPLHQKPTAHISYHEGLRLIRSFLEYASHHTVEEIQAFTSQWVPNPRWVKVDQIAIPAEIITKAANTLIGQLGGDGIEKVGGSRWWQWRYHDSELKAEWIEMRGDYTERKRKGEKGRRVMLYVHGGAYFFGSVDEHRYQMQRHARKLRARVFAPRYRLAPQFPFPCGLQDCLAAYLYLLTVQEPEEIILAGDSAGGGMVVSILVTLRDQGLPLPAGAILISPWVDLTHSFPSVAGHADLDYIPAHGFMQKPSLSWPPPNDAEMEQIAKGQLAGKRQSRKWAQKERGNPEAEAMQGVTTLDQTHAEPTTTNHPAQASDRNTRPNTTTPPTLSIQIDNTHLTLHDQIQLYTPNHLLTHPLVSPILQPTLGSLPPLLILTGGGELLRDEQIYLAHKAARPATYPLYRDEAVPPSVPTDVQLQVWDDLCHVAPTLSFTRPAKLMYGSIAQFGAWALARAQRRGIEIPDDGSASDSDSDADSAAAVSAEPKPPNGSLDPGPPAAANSAHTHRVGRAGSPLPAFTRHMIRQRVTRHGVIYPMEPEAEMPALCLPAEEVGVVKAEPVRRWLAAKREWDGRYARERGRVLRRRMAEGWGEWEGEMPPRSAVVRRMGGGREGEEGGRNKKKQKKKKKKKSWGMMLWSLWGSKYDESTIKRDEEEEEEEAAVAEQQPQAAEERSQPAASHAKDPPSPSARSRSRPRTTSTSSRPRPRRKSTASSHPAAPRPRRRTVTVSDQGQTEAQADLEQLRRCHRDATADAMTGAHQMLAGAETPCSSVCDDVFLLSPTSLGTPHEGQAGLN